MTNLKAYVRKYPKLSLLSISLFFFILPCQSFADGTLVDFENGLLYRTVHGYDSHFDEYLGATVNLSSPGLLGSDHCMRSYSADSGDSSYHHWIEDSHQGTRIGEADGADRFSFYALFPSDLIANSDNNFHVGTYTNTGDTYNNGRHYYHYFRIYGSPYPIHLLCNEHPQNKPSDESEQPDNPESWDYMTGWTRFYLQLIETKYTSRPFSIYYDDLKFYSLGEPENDETVNNLWVGYFGGDNWRMGFALNCQHTSSCAAKTHDYQVRYSTSPITNANFASATIAGIFNYDSSTYNQVTVTFSLTNTDDSGATQYYFAVDDLDDGTGYVSKIDYRFGQGVDPALLPTAPSDLTVISNQ